MRGQGRALEICSVILISILIGVVLGGAWEAQAQGESIPVDIELIDLDKKTIVPKETVTYNWTVTNMDINNTYRIEVFKSETKKGWTVNLNQEIFTLEPNSSWRVVLSVTPPKDMTKGKLSVSLRFEIENETSGWNVSVPSVTTTVYQEPKVMNLFDNPLPPPFDNKNGVFLLDVIIWMLIVVIAYITFERGIHHWTKKTKTELDDIIFGIIRSPILVLLILYGVVSSLEVLDLPGYVLGYVQQIYLIILIIVGTWVVFKLFKDVLIYYGRVYAERTETQIDDIIIPVVEKVGAIIIIITAVAILLSYTGIDLTMLAVGSIVISMVIAFALQDTISNFFSGIYILTDRPFKVGDLILLESGEVCEIKHIGMRSTRLYNTFEHTLIIMPNNKLANDKIVNYTEPDTKFRITISVGAAYGIDPDKVLNILIDIANNHLNVVKDREIYKPTVRFTKFADSSLNFELVVFIDEVDNRFKVTTELNKEIDRRFKEEKVEIPFPQRVVWMRDAQKK